MNGGVAKARSRRRKSARPGKGLANLRAGTLATYQIPGLDAIVATIVSAPDTERELALIQDVAPRKLRRRGGPQRNAWGPRRGPAPEALARAVVKLADGRTGAFHPLYPDEMPLIEKTRAIAREIMARATSSAEAPVRRKFEGAGGARATGDCRSASPRRKYSFSAERDPARRADRHVAPIG